MNAADKALLIDGHPIAYEVRLSSLRRTMSIEVHPDLRVIVRAPARCNAGLICARVAERSRWIGRQLERFRRARHERMPLPQYVSGEPHLYLGNTYRLVVGEAARAGVTQTLDELRVATRGSASRDRIGRALENWYRARAREVFDQVLTERFGVFEGQGHPCPSLTIRKMTTRWGSLTARRRMTLNLALIRAPRECIEYVVVHELCHLEHRGHGPAFHRLMDELMPDWRALKRRLEATLRD